MAGFSAAFASTSASASALGQADPRARLCAFVCLCVSFGNQSMPEPHCAHSVPRRRRRRRNSSQKCQLAATHSRGRPAGSQREGRQTSKHGARMQTSHLSRSRSQPTRTRTDASWAAPPRENILLAFARAPFLRARMRMRRSGGGGGGHEEAATAKRRPVRIRNERVHKRVCTESIERAHQIERGRNGRKWRNESPSG